MHLYSILFLLAAYLKFSEACLVIRYSKPPACACKTLKLDSSNAKENEVKDNDLYELVLSSQIKSPEILIDDCFIQIGDYSLDGFCDPYQQKWQVDTGNGMEQYKELKGVCVLKETATCLPTDPATLLFAYSNDLVYYPDVFMVMQVVMSTDEETRYKTAATVRFDTKTKGDIVFHEGATQNDSFSKAQAHVEEQKLDPSQSFDSLETGSDVLDMLEAMYNLPFHMYSDAYYSLNVKASGTGSMVLPPLNITKKLKNSYLVVGVQSTEPYKLDSNVPTFNTKAMNLYSILFLLAAYLTFSDACLVIRYDKPPACACKTLKLDSSNIKENEVKDNDLYDLVLSSEIKSPEILIDDCSVQVRCEGGSELYIFDTDKGAEIGDFALDGFCDLYQQKWQVDTGNGIEQYKELKGVCVLKKVEKCSPTDPATFLFAYSNDLDYSDVAKLYSEYGYGVSKKIKYTVAATVRFDTKTKEDIVFHEGETVVDSYK
ncbi:hypothetical protein B9Z55_003406 [Caenorhabditis nigoni]|uniref:Ricin B lectin domain-containing protein n=1 Tax=Caenorhabditis nigoni TaxID=1611254 RepID=A0A2G5VQU6_9PELO|nr:hypothetical protein B9Z55_003406 [Caenorhabditis nigoni]